MVYRVIRFWSRWRDRFLLRQHLRAGLQLGKNVRIIGKPYFGGEAYLIKIGNHVLISSQVTFITHDGGTWVFKERPEYRGLERFATIEVKDNCFIGSRTIIMPGVSIGPNAVVGAGSVVTESVPPNTVVVGVPARIIGTLEEYLQGLLPKCQHIPPEVNKDFQKKRALVLRLLM